MNAKEETRIYAGLLFDLNLFLYTVTSIGLSMADDVKGIGVETHLRMYYGGQLLLLAGYLVYGFLSERLRTDIANRVALVSVVLCLVLRTGVDFSTWITLYVAEVMLINFCLGILGGLTYHRTAMLLLDDKGLPMVLFAAGGAVIALQYVLQLLLGRVFGLHISSHRLLQHCVHPRHPM